MRSPRCAPVNSGAPFAQRWWRSRSLRCLSRPPKLELEPDPLPAGDRPIAEPERTRSLSPGRTWESASRAFAGLLAGGDVLDAASGDGALAELIAPGCRSLTCLDVSAKVVAAGQKRLARFGHARFVEGDMHQLPFDADSFDLVLLMSALPYARDVRAVLREVARVLRPTGGLIGGTLARHKHAQAVAPYGHVNLGFATDELRADLEATGFDVALCEVTHTERRTPHFQIITLHAARRS
ncbi:MAG: class I SAM-dependent methyltransferase [Myxococcota bacterium]